MINSYPSKETVERLRERYPEGTLVELVSMDDPFSKLKPGDRGRVSDIDDTGTVFVAWDSGSGLGLVYGVDSFKKIEQELVQPSVLKTIRDSKKAPKQPHRAKDPSPKHKGDAER
jgi:hypothetical protein